MVTRFVWLILFSKKPLVLLMHRFLHPGTQARLTKIISMARQQAGVFEKVSTELILRQIPLFLALNLKSKITPGPGLVHGMELLGVQGWNPVSFDIQGLFSEYSKQTGLEEPPSEKDIADVQKRSVKWPGSSLGESWLLNKVIEYTIEPGSSVQEVGPEYL